MVRSSVPTKLVPSPGFSLEQNLLKDGWTLLESQWVSITMGQTGLHNSQCGDDTASLGRDLTKLESIASMEDSLSAINSHVSVTTVSLQGGGHWLWFVLERDGTHQVCILKTWYPWMVSLWLSTQICGENWSHAQLCSKPMIPPCHGMMMIMMSLSKQCLMKWLIVIELFLKVIFVWIFKYIFDLIVSKTKEMIDLLWLDRTKWSQVETIKKTTLHHILYFLYGSS